MNEIHRNSLYFNLSEMFDTFDKNESMAQKAIIVFPHRECYAMSWKVIFISRFEEHLHNLMDMRE